MGSLSGPANIRMGLNYAPIKKLYIGAGLTKERMQIDVNAKYAIFLQTPGKMPGECNLFWNAAMDTRGDCSMDIIFLTGFLFHAVNHREER